MKEVYEIYEIKGIKLKIIIKEKNNKWSYFCGGDESPAKEALKNNILNGEGYDTCEDAIAAAKNNIKIATA